MIRRRPTFIDLFAGCGGLSLGFVRAGFRPVLAIEWDKDAAATYAANFGESIVFRGDISTVDLARIPVVDVVVGGPPCQGFSGLGKRNPDDARNKLWRQYIRIVRAANPKAFLIENVPGFLRSPEFAELIRELKGGVLKEYDFAADLIDAAAYGVPQHRKRAFLFASRVGQPSLPSASHGLGIRHRPYVTVEDAFSSIPPEPTGNDLPVRRTQLLGTVVQGPFSSAEIHVGRSYAPDSLARYDAVPPGGNRFDLPDHLQFACWRRKPSGTTDVLGRLSWERPAVTIRTEFHKPEKGRYLHPRYHHPDLPRANRALTHREAAVLQSFPETFLWCGSKIQIAKQIGNAVPPRLAEAIAREAVFPLVRWRITSALQSIRSRIGGLFASTALQGRALSRSDAAADG